MIAVVTRRSSAALASPMHKLGEFYWHACGHGSHLLPVPGTPLGMSPPPFLLPPCQHSSVTFCLQIFCAQPAGRIPGLQHPGS